MIPQEIIDQIIEYDIVKILEREGLTLRKNGVNYACSCPFHTDKTPSLIVSPAKNIWKCFSCMKGGNAITYLQQKDNLTFPEAVEHLCGVCGIDYTRQELTPEQEEERFRKSEIYTINLVAKDYYCEQYNATENAKKYATKARGISDECIGEYFVGYAPDKGGFLQHAHGLGYKDDVLLRSGLVKRSDRDGSLYDTFRGRLMFPIRNRTGNVIAFSGRLIKEDPEKKFPKYLNTAETEVFVKGDNLFGYYEALAAGRAQRTIYLVEGNLDAIRLHQIGIENAVASLGTALTPNQIRLISRIVDSVVIIADSDSAGHKASITNGEALVKSGLSVRIMNLPVPKGQKSDADSYFLKHPKSFNTTLANHTSDFIPWIADGLLAGIDSPTERLPHITRICELLASCKDDRIVNIHIETLSKSYKPAKLWMDELRRIKEKLERKRLRQDTEDSDEMLSEYGFYINRNSYYNVKNTSLSNFTMTPILHIRDSRNARRIFKLTNSDNQEQIVKLKQEELVSFQSFKVVTESMGNYVWMAGQNELMQLKRYLYKNMPSADEVKQLGWQKRHQIYVWGNGAFDGGNFTKIDEFGLIDVHDQLLYIPGCAKDTEQDVGAFQTQRKFVHQNMNTISMKEYSENFCQVFGDNAKVSLCFLVATLFRDLIVNTTTAFPILNIFGPKGTGKTNCARSLMAFFQRDYHPLNIMSTTRAALGEAVAEISNGVVHIDEYKNTLELEKREFLKGIWDGTGRNKMNIDNDKRRETTLVDCGVVLTGQEMPTADPALFSRLVFLSFHKTTFSQEEKRLHDKLKLTEHRGLSHLTLELLKLRPKVSSGYRNAYDSVLSDFMRELGAASIEDRTLKNWVTIVAAYKCVEESVEFPFNYNEILDIAVKMCIVQNAKTSSSSELAGFWESLEALVASAKVYISVDYTIKPIKKAFQIKESNIPVEMPAGKKILFLRFNRVAQLYAREARETESKKIPKDSLKYYLETSPEFLGTHRSVRFKALSSNNYVAADDSAKGTITQAMAFDYELLQEKYAIEINIDAKFEDINDDLNEEDCSDEKF